jgi:rhodanese-related sulfurtransferase
LTGSAKLRMSAIYGVSVEGVPAMKVMYSAVLLALVIAGVWCAGGVCVLSIPAKPSAWIYESPESLNLEGVKVQLIDEKLARALLGSSDTVFLDSRKLQDYAKSHVKGSIFLSADELPLRFVTSGSLPAQVSRIVVYCCGPECDMAERTAGVLIRMGYKNLTIMKAGFVAWEKAGYPVETAPDKIEGPNFWEQEEESLSCCEIADVLSTPERGRT